MTAFSEILFIDPSVSDVEVVLSGLRPGVEGHVLSADRPAGEQIAAALAGRGAVDVVHVMAHGAPGRVDFGAGALTLEGLADFAGDLDLTDKALRLWVCETGAGDAGRRFVSALAAATGAHVSASTRRVGAGRLGGSWNLEGSQDPAPITAEAMARYEHVLALGESLAAASDSGTVGDGITNDNTPTINITGANFFTTYYIYVDGTKVGSVNTSFSSSATFTLPSALSSGAHAIYVTTNSTSATGGVSMSVTIDTTAPAVPSVPDLATASDTGVSSTDNITSATTPTFTGTAEAGSTVTIYSDGVAVGTGVATGGNYSIVTSALAAGTHSITATATDVAGNVSTLSSGLSVTIDTTAPAVPSVPDLATASDTGSSSTDNITKTAAPTFTGTAEAGSTVTIYSDGVAVGTGVATGGAYSITTSALAGGTHSITATATDAAGNVSTVSSGLSVTIDTTIAVPSVPDLATASDTGSSSTDNITKTTAPTFTGTAEAGSTVTIYSDGVAVGTGVATGGAYSIVTSALAAGTHSITATATDAAGNVSTVSSGLSVTIDTTAPAVPSTPDLATASDLGVSSTDNLTSATTPTFTGTAEAGSTVTIYSDGVAVGSGVATGGAYSIATSALAGGTHSITATATDAAGNVSTVSSGLSVTIDTTAPTGGTPDLITASDSGSSSTDNVTKTTNPTFQVALNGTVAAGDTVELKVGGASLANPVTHVITAADVTAGFVQLTVTAGDLGADGAKSVTAVFTDPAGNTSTTTALSITLDTTIAVPSVPDLATASDTGSSSTDNITKTTAPTFTGTAEAGSTVTIYSDGVAVGTGVATGGAYSIVTSALAAGTHSITATATDAAGNVSTVSSGLSVTIDTTAPAVPSTPDLATASDLGVSSTDNLTSATTPTFTGTAEAGSTVTIYSDGVAVGSGVATGGAYSIATSALAGGTHSITATATDAAGNVSTVSSGLSVTIDTTAPTGGTPDLITASDSGSSSTDNVTKTTNPTFQVALNGTVAAGDTVELKVGGASLANPVTHVITAADVTAGFVQLTVTAGDLGVDGAKSVTAVFTDPAGNTSTTAALSVTLDTAAPAVPSVPDLATASDLGSSSTDNLTSATTPTFTGTAEAGSTVTIYSDGVAVGSGVATGGAYSIATSALAGGTHSITATATDAAGNVSTVSSGLSVTIDTTAPTGGTPDLITASDSGTSSSDNITSATTPTFQVALNGTVAAGDSVELKVGGASLAHPVTHVITAADVTAGFVQLTVTAGDLGADGAKSVTAVFTDPAGNTSTTTALSITLDTTIAVPSVPDLATASDTGSSSTDNITKTTAPTFTGTAEAGSTVTIYSDGVAVGTGVATGGAYSIVTSALAAGTHSITATATDAAGNVSTVSSGLSVTIDTTAPAVPSTPDLATASDLGVSSTDNLTSATTPTFTGTAEAGSTVTIYSDGVAVGSGVATGGAYSIATSALAGGTHSITATATDAAGNVSTVSSGLSVTIDTTAPAITNLSADDTGVSFTATDAGSSTLTLSGALAAAFGNPSLTSGAASVVTPTAQASVTSGTLTVQDAAGNATGVLKVDLGTAGADSISDGSTSGALYGFGGNDTLVGGTGADTLSGGAGADVFNFAAGDSALTFGGSGTAGTLSGNDVITDFATGTTAAGSEKIGFTGAALASSGTVNGTNSSLQLHTGSAVSSHSITNGIITFDDTGTFASAVALTSLADVAAVAQYLQGNDIGTTGSTVAFTATIAGVTHTYIYVQGATGVGTNNVLVDLNDVSASSISAASNQISVIDSVAPTGGTPDLITASDSGNSSTDNLTKTTNPTFQVSLGAGTISGDVVELKVGGSSLAHPVIHVVTAADILAGFVQLTITSGDLGTDGPKSVTAVFSDAAGNTSTSSALSVSFDTTAPVISTVSDGSGSPDVVAGQAVTLTLNFDGAVTAAPGAILNLSSGGTATYVSGTGTTQLVFSYTPPANGAGVTVTGASGLADAAGNAVSSFGQTICFMAGTSIATPTGGVAVENLKAGDLVLTADGKIAPVRWLGRQTISTLFADPMRALPIRVRAGALGEALPARDLLISPDHALLIDGVLTHASALVNGLSIVRETEVARTFIYYHVELDDHALVLAEGVPAETFIDNVDRLAFDNWAEHATVWSDRPPMVEMSYPRVKAHRQVPRATRQRLAARAIARHAPANAVA